MNEHAGSHFSRWDFWNDIFQNANISFKFSNVLFL